MTQIGTFTLHLAVFKVNLNRGTLIHMAASQPTRKRRDLGQATKLVRWQPQRPAHTAACGMLTRGGVGGALHTHTHRLPSLTRSAA